MDKIILYLDNCCFNRPYDDQSYLSIFMETQAKLAIQELVRNEKINIVWSFILDFENSANPDETIKQEIHLWRQKACFQIMKNEAIMNKAKKMTELGFRKKDALHIASAIEGKVHYFITVDKGILKKKNKVKELMIMSPIEFITFLEEQNNED